MEDVDQKIRVIVRKRPVSNKQRKRGDFDILSQRSPHTIVVRQQKQKVDLTKFIEEHHFTYDRVFSQTFSNSDIYNQTVQPLVQAAFQGTKVTCFAYGQTGSGKTFTMMGQGQVPGLFLLSAQDIFKLKHSQYPKTSVHVAFYEIYCNKLHDLLNQRNQLFAREDAKQNINIVGLHRKQVQNVDSLMEIMEYGMSTRTVGQTGANDNSSRSHGVFEITLRESQKIRGKMLFIDLAGSERGADVSSSDAKTRMDSGEINKSLLALKECIRALDQDKKHTPFRGSKLTQVLKDCFIGNCKTVMIANVSPCLSSCEHTLNTLRYSDRVKELKKGGPKSNSNVLMLPRQAQNVVRYNVQNQRPESPLIQPQQNRKPKQPSINLSNSSPILYKGKKKETPPVQMDHQQLIGQILSEEEDLILTHKSMIDSMVDALKHQMQMLNQVDKPGSDISKYTSQLDKILDFKQEMISGIRSKLRVFQSHLKQEQSMRKTEMDVFDLSLNEDELIQTQKQIGLVKWTEKGYMEKALDVLIQALIVVQVFCESQF